MRDEGGFTLIEVVVALAMLVGAVGSLAAVTLTAERAQAAARQADVAQRAAAEKLEQLRGLAWTSDAGLLPLSDWSTALAETPPSSAGPGLGESPGDTLAASTPGYSDVLDADGGWVAAGPASPAGAVWERRWSVLRLPGLNDTLLLQVLVVPHGITGAAPTLASARGANGTWLMDVRMRRAR